MERGPDALQPFFTAVNWLSQPPVFYTCVAAACAGALYWRKQLVRPAVAAVAAGIALVLMGLCAFSPQFAQQAGRPDNVALWLMLAGTAFFLWIALRQATRNDERAHQNQPPEEAELAEQKLHVWPYLLYIELIAAVAATALLFVWAMALDAPLEQPANPAVSPSVSKAPWYFVGLQELLVYFDPWFAGVVLPVMTITGLICVPYCDPNPDGVGQYGFEKRRWAISVYLFGFLIIWIAPIFVGELLRGPHWNAYGLCEPWDVPKAAANDVELSQAVWSLAGVRTESLHWLTRELPGIVLVGLYLAAVPAVVAKVRRQFYERLGFVRYSLVMLHLLVMLAVPIKMGLRWVFDVRHVVAVPEHFFGL